MRPKHTYKLPEVSKRDASNQPRRARCARGSRKRRQRQKRGARALRKGLRKAVISHHDDSNATWVNNVPSKGTTLPRLKPVAAARAILPRLGWVTYSGRNSFLPGLAVPSPSVVLTRALHTMTRGPLPLRGGRLLPITLCVGVYKGTGDRFVLRVVSATPRDSLEWRPEDRDGCPQCVKRIISGGPGPCFLPEWPTGSFLPQVGARI